MCSFTLSPEMCSDIIYYLVFSPPKLQLYSMDQQLGLLMGHLIANEGDFGWKLISFFKALKLPQGFVIIEIVGQIARKYSFCGIHTPFLPCSLPQCLSLADTSPGSQRILPPKGNLGTMGPTPAMVSYFLCSLVPSCTLLGPQSSLTSEGLT